MTFKWLDFLKSNSVSYVTFGPNTKQGEVSIKCPMCTDDPSEHLGINLDTGFWACWRNAAHRGKQPYRLIAALLNCSFSHARLIIDQYSITDTDAFNTLDISFDTPKKDTPNLKELSFPKEFKKIKSIGTGKRFYHYLRGRGFANVKNLTFDYDLHYCTTGDWKDRIIIPIYESGELVTWTARAIAHTEKAPRYKTLSVNEEGQHKALINITNTIFLYDQLNIGGDILFITEGPVDAMKIDYYGHAYGASATCLFTSSISTSQVYLISEVSKGYKSIILLLDPEAVEQQLEIQSILARYGVKIGTLESGIEDPGAMTKEQVVRLINSISEQF